MKSSWTSETFANVITLYDPQQIKCQLDEDSLIELQYLIYGEYYEITQPL